MSPGLAETVAKSPHAQLANGCGSTEPSEASQIGIHAFEVEKFEFPFRSVRLLRDKQLRMSHKRRFSIATSGPRWTLVIEFIPICIHLILDRCGTFELLVLKR